MKILLFCLLSFLNKTSDTSLFAIRELMASDSNSLEIVFSETPDQTDLANLQHYLVSDNIGIPLTIIADGSDLQRIRLLFSDNFPSRTNLQIRINGIYNIERNEQIDTTISFCIYKPAPFDIVIDEIMADPSPPIIYPEVEWIEIRNVSPFMINLSGWRIAKQSFTSGPMPSFLLKPDSSVLVCSTGSMALMNQYCAALSVTSFPSLTNTGDMVMIKSPEEKIIHAVNYSEDWYQNELKKQGGWSLEMIDLNNPCTGAENWSASQSTNGATPGKINSIDALNTDEVSPRLVHAFASDSLHVKLFFNEPLDSLEAINASHYLINEQIGNPVFVSAEPPLFQEIDLVLNHPLIKNKTYVITVNGIKDCVSNEIGIYNNAKLGLSETADSFDVAVNEVLFNPTSDGADFVELFNRSGKTINLKELYIANRNTIDSIDNIVPASDEDYLLFPGEYIALTSDPAAIKRHYISEQPEKILLVDGFPSYNDDEGDVVILNRYGKIVDEIKYDESWHFKLLDNKEGVSLERIDANSKTQDQENWHSAASDVGYATPAYKNSQQYTDNAIAGNVFVEPKIISPNNDGKDDFAVLRYVFSEPGYVANITVFDDAGRVVKTLRRNALCGKSGSFIWDGLNDKKQKPPNGIYIILTDTFNLKGERKKFRNAIVLMR